MGNRSSSSLPAGVSVQILAVGLPNTGKTHFLSLMSEGRMLHDTGHHTPGYFEADALYRQKRFRVRELGGIFYKQWSRMLPRDMYLHCVFWFVNDSDCSEELYRSRNAVLSLLRSSSNLSEVPVCVIQNVGMPKMTREVEIQRISGMGCAAADNRIKYNPYTPCAGTKLKTIEDVRDRLDLRALSSDRDVYMTQISYTEGSSFQSLFDWILDQTRK